METIPIYIFIYIFFAACFAHMSFSEISARRNMVKETTGVITRFAEHSFISTRVRRYSMYVAYAVNDEQYENKVRNVFVPPFLSKGQQIRIYYDPANPSRIRSDTSIFWLLFCGVGCIVVPILLIARVLFNIL